MNTKIASGLIVASLGGIATIITALKPSPACEIGNGILNFQSCGNSGNKINVDYSSQNSEEITERK